MTKSFVALLREFDDMTAILLDGVSREQIFDAYIQHIQSEVDELKQAFEEKDEIEIIDALCDITYLTIGMATRTGFDFERHFKAVHDSNMAKVIVNDRLIKPKGWPDPDIQHRHIIANPRQGPGRLRQYPDQATRQKAYRERKKQKSEEPSSEIQYVQPDDYFGTRRDNVRIQTICGYWFSRHSR